jgi:glycerophosphoryl diester phosphodiesterase
VLNIGHRGAAGHSPENTIPSFEKALELGADGIELDVRLTADAQLVVVHNPVVGGHSVQNSTYEDIRNAEAPSKIPLLADVLASFGGRAYLDVEIKTFGFEPSVIALLEKYGDRSRTVITSFHPQVLARVRQLTAEWQLGFIYNRTQDQATRHNLPLDVVVPQFRLASRELLEAAHSEGLKVFAWTVNDRQEASRLIGLGVDGLISDYPDRIAELVKGEPAAGTP